MSLLEQQKGPVGLMVFRAGHGHKLACEVVPQIYMLSKMMNFIGHAQSRFATHDVLTAQPRNTGYKALGDVINELNAGRHQLATTFESLLYRAPIFLHVSLLLEFAIKPIKG